MKFARRASEEGPRWRGGLTADHLDRFGQMAEDFAWALREVQCDVTCLQIKDRTYGSVAARIAEEGDPVRTAILEFVVRQNPKREDR